VTADSGGLFGPTFLVFRPATPLVAIPEPSSPALLALSAGALAGWRRWKRRGGRPGHRRWPMGQGIRASL
jgi:hypothetical protein